MNRLLGSLEHFLWLIDQTIPMNVVLCATIKGSLTVDQLKEALVWVQRKHPLLAVRIVIDEHEQPRFVSEGVSYIPLRSLARQGENHWCQEAEAELFRPFAWSEGPLIRVILLHSPDISDLIVTFDHCIGDGLSGAYLIRDILREVSEPGSDRQLFPELPPREELIPLPYITRSRDSVDQLTGLEIVKNPASMEEEILGDWQLRLLHWCLPSWQTAALLSRCRQEQTSVYGAICASFFLSIADEVKSGNKAVIKCLSPLNIRNYLEPPIGENFGAYYTGGLISHQLSNSQNFWEVAREVKSQINHLMENGKMFDSVPELRAFLSAKLDPIVLRQYVEALKGSDITVTNLGRLNIPQQYGALQLQKLYVTVTGIKNEPIIVGTATIGDNMFITFRYLESLISQPSAEKINKKAMQILSEVIS
ncbi:MAG TPA: hypothetical protein V6D12_05745 [Candidatus Obscuribacterales bacterium]